MQIWFLYFLLKFTSISNHKILKKHLHPKLKKSKNHSNVFHKTFARFSLFYFYIQHITLFLQNLKLIHETASILSVLCHQPAGIKNTSWLRESNIYIKDVTLLFAIFNWTFHVIAGIAIHSIEWENFVVNESVCKEGDVTSFKIWSEFYVHMIIFASNELTFVIV